MTKKEIAKAVEAITVPAFLRERPVHGKFTRRQFDDAVEWLQGIHDTIKPIAEQLGGMAALGRHFNLGRKVLLEMLWYTNIEPYQAPPREEKVEEPEPPPEEIDPEFRRQFIACWNQIARPSLVKDYEQMRKAVDTVNRQCKEAWLTKATKEVPPPPTVYHIEQATQRLLKEVAARLDEYALRLAKLEGELPLGLTVHDGGKAKA